MSVARASLVTALLLLCTARVAHAQDAGTPPATCLDLDEAGRCFGAVAAFCAVPNVDGGGAAGAVIAVDCAARGDGAACVQIAGFGAWCALPPGGDCTATGDGARAQLACGAVDGGVDGAAACDLVEGCVADVGPCAAAGTCAGERLVVGCAAFGQATTLGCGALGGACADSACRDLPAGAPCDDALLRCGGEATCIGIDPDGGAARGACIAPLATGERADPPAPPPALTPPSCAHHGGPGDDVTAWIWAAAIVLITLRRR